MDQLPMETVFPYPVLSYEWFHLHGKDEITITTFPHLSFGWHQQLGTLQQSPLLNDCYPDLSMGWFQRRGELYGKNVNRLLKKESSETDIKMVTQQVGILATKESSHKKRVDLEAVIEVIQYFASNGPVVLVQDLIAVYKEYKERNGHSAGSQIRPSVFLRKLKMYAAFESIPVFGRTYAVLKPNINLERLTSLLNHIPQDMLQSKINESISTKIGDIFDSALKMASTKLDRDIIKGLFANATSGKFTAKLMGVKNKESVMGAKNQINHRAKMFQSLKMSSNVVRNDMTNTQQTRLSKSIFSKRWFASNRLSFENRGRKLKFEEFPELSTVMEHIFETGDRGVGGGLESHPRLTCETLFRSNDNALTMPEARKIILKVAPPDFVISLSSCYNYTNSYKANSNQSKQHHLGQNINANISLRKPPRIGVSRLVPNLHWTTKNINLELEKAENDANSYIIDSRDAKTIISGDIQPVQLPGKSWRKIHYEDHTWDQSRDNAVYPMTHLLLDVLKYKDSSDEQNITTRTVTRTGKPISFVYLAFYEKETTFNAMNELFRLFTLSELDEKLRNREGKIRDNLLLLVDNGHGEDPDSPLTQMCMVRILLFMRLRKISQRAFAEYHSKRNFVERVHAAENEVLSRHGAFDSKKRHPNVSVGSTEHRENMDLMAQDVVDCLQQARFNDQYLLAMRGDEATIFDDEKRLKEFLALSEENKSSCGWTYSVKDNSLVSKLQFLWDADDKMKRTYYDDYTLIRNMGEKRTAWLDKYSTTLYNPVTNNQVSYELQPIPDFVRWLESDGELHYSSTERTQVLTENLSSLQNRPGLFIPDKLIQQFHTICPNPPDEVLRYIALVCWVPVETVKERMKELEIRMEKDIKDQTERANWTEHKLYKCTVGELRERCKKNSLNTRGLKHEMVKRLAGIENSEIRRKQQQPLTLQQIPSTLADIKNVPIHIIKRLLNENGICTLANKDELVLRLYLLKNNRRHVISYHVRKSMVETIEIAESVIAEQLKIEFTRREQIRRQRKYATKGIKTSKIALSDDVQQANDLLDIFNECKSYLKYSDVDTDSSVSNSNSSAIDLSACRERYFEIGATIKVKWSKEELGSLGWKPAWYTAHVQSSNLDRDEITVVYLSEPDVVYTIEVTPHLSSGKIRLLAKV